MSRKVIRFWALRETMVSYSLPAPRKPGAERRVRHHVKCAETVAQAQSLFPAPPTRPHPWAQGTLHARALPTRGHRTAPPAPLRGGTPADRVSLGGRVLTRNPGPLRQKRPRLPSLQFGRCRRLPRARSVRGAPTHRPTPPPRPVLPAARSPLGPGPTLRGSPQLPRPWTWGPGIVSHEGLEAAEGRAGRRRRGCTCAEGGSERRGAAAASWILAPGSLRWKSGCTFRSAPHS